MEIAGLLLLPNSIQTTKSHSWHPPLPLGKVSLSPLVHVFSLSSGMLRKNCGLCPVTTKPVPYRHISASTLFYSSSILNA